VESRSAKRNYCHDALQLGRAHREWQPKEEGLQRSTICSKPRLPQHERSRAASCSDSTVRLLHKWGWRGLINRLASLERWSSQRPNASTMYVRVSAPNVRSGFDARSDERQDREMALSRQHHYIATYTVTSSLDTTPERVHSGSRT
jgi:hypothetical protein